MNVSPNENQRLRTIPYFDQIMFAASASDFTGESRLNPTDRIVALGILQYVNRAAGATYVDRLTLAKRLDIKHPAVMTATRRLAERGDLKITERPGKTPLLSPIPKECSEHSQRGDKAFYAARGKVIQQLVFERRLTPAERLAGLAFLALVDPDSYECDASQRYVAQTFGLERKMLSSLYRSSNPWGTSHARPPTASCSIWRWRYRWGRRWGHQWGHRQARKPAK